MAAVRREGAAAHALRRGSRARAWSAGRPTVVQAIPIQEAVGEANAPTDGYTVLHVYPPRPRTVVWAARRASDGASVVLEHYVEDRGDGAAGAWREVAHLERAAGPSVPRCLDVRAGMPKPTLVLEELAEITVAAWMRDARPALESALAVAHGVAVTLARLHDRDLLHCGLSTVDVLVRPKSRATSVIELGQAHRLGPTGSPPELVDPPSASPHSIQLIAPEQSGRIDRGIDPRRDLYALGTVLCATLTGTSPFVGEDALALIHAHMARLPSPSTSGSARSRSPSCGSRCECSRRSPTRDTRPPAHWLESLAAASTHSGEPVPSTTACASVGSPSRPSS